MEIRNFRWEDMPAIVDLSNRYAKSMGSQTIVTQAVLEKSWRAPHNHPERDCFVAFLPAEGLVGYTIADLLDTPNRANGVYCVLPNHREVANALIDATERHFVAMAHAAGAADALMTYMLSDQAHDGVAVLEQRAYEYARTFNTMQMVFDAPIVPEPVHAGITMRPFDPAHDARKAYDAQLDAFSDHWNFYVPPFEEWLYDVGRPDFDPQHWWLAWAGDDIVGLVLSEKYTPDMAWVNIVGVRAHWRRHGIGLALLKQCFAVHQAQGRREVRLGVDVNNRYQASAVYERAGMHVLSRTLYYQKELMGTLA